MLKPALAPVLAVAISMAVLTSCDSDNALTPPGSQLEFGETAYVTRDNGAGTLALTVEEIEQGDPADLAQLVADGAEGIDGATPYYVRVELTPEAGSGVIEINDYLALFAGDDALTHLSVFVDFARCQESPIEPKDPATPQQTCLVYLGEDGAPDPDSVYFDNDDDYDAYDGNAVSWQ